MTEVPCLDCGRLIHKRAGRRNARCASCTNERDREHNRAVQRVAYQDPLYRSIPLIGQCVECGSTTDLTRDHRVPLVDGGANTADNIRILCRSCNSAKGARRAN